MGLPVCSTRSKLYPPQGDIMRAKNDPVHRPSSCDQLLARYVAPHQMTLTMQGQNRMGGAAYFETLLAKTNVPIQDYHVSDRYTGRYSYVSRETVVLVRLACGVRGSFR